MTSKSKSYCSVPQCNNYISKNISMHRFPRDSNLQKKWQIAMKIGKPVSKYMMVCSEHFVSTDYSLNTPNPKIKHLKRNAIPSQKVPVITHQYPVKIRKSRKYLLQEQQQNICSQQHTSDSVDDATFQTNLDTVTIITDPSLPSTSTSPSILKDLVVKTEENHPDSQEFEMHRSSPPLHFNKRSRTEPSSSELQQAYNIMKMVSNNIRSSDEYSAFGDVVGHKIRKLRTENLRNLAQVQINDILYELAMSSENGQEEPSAWSSTSNTGEIVDVKVEVEEIDLLGNAEK